jgi:predicted ribosome quality control (RQC) complex YloA/Tae2 family protein
MSSVLLYFLEKELKVLEGGKVEKIYQLDKENIIFRIYKDKVKYNFRICVPSFVCFTNQSFNTPTLPPSFCMFLRKYLSSAKIELVEQKDFERILIITFSSRSEKYFLIVELFKPGNIILCKMQDNILIVLNSFERQRFKDRVIQARKEYVFPPALLNPLSISPSELVDLINRSDKNLVKTMSSKLGLGGFFAEEIILRAGVDKNLSEISTKEADLLIKGIKSFFSEEVNPCISNNNVFPFALKDKSCSPAKSISEAIDSLNIFETEGKDVVSKKKKDKVSSLVDIQEKMISNLEQKAIENQKKGEFIYSNYQSFQKLIEEANKIRASDGLDVLEKKMKSNKKFKSIDKKDKVIVLDF